MSLRIKAQVETLLRQGFLVHHGLATLAIIAIILYIVLIFSLVLRLVPDRNVLQIQKQPTEQPVIPQPEQD